MKNIVICFLLVICTQLCYATENKSISGSIFSGTVVDASTKKPVADVLIIAHGQETGDDQKFTTDQHGQYKIPSLPVGTYTLRFEKMNYKPVEKRNVSVKKTSVNTKLNVELLNEDESDEDHHSWQPRYEII